ncbi:FeoA family protein [Vibrio salinus]|uniref:FeoA family protein n=1 Tax=Vibrio salinus TaxID=2899784 RepID=UPI001E35FE6E|nr:FeoA family protein [Vibrio salinus]MCE0495007.1 ferrous iron transport protein A [Vibrio salinus]
MNTLPGIKLGGKGRVSGFEAGSKSYRRHLLSLGLTPGTEFQVTRIAPLGDPIEIRVRGTAISLRKHEATVVLVDEI